jgi:hypothetical protein
LADDLFDLVALKVADKMPPELSRDFGVLGGYFFPLAPPLLDVIFPEIPQPGPGRFQDFFQALLLGNPDQAYGIKGPSGPLQGAADALLKGFKGFLERGHGEVLNKKIAK